NVACNGASTGTATVTASGGTPPYSYSWNTTPVQTTATASGLAAGSYTVTVTDANGCTATATITITQPTSLSATTAITNVSCNGGSNGSVAITPAGGTGPYTISPAQTGLAAGNYTFTVKDANGCSINVPVTITQPTPITATTAITNVSCNGGSNGSVIITPSGGTSPYTITPTQTGLAAGNYTFTVTDANGCSINVSVTITQPTPVTATTAITNVSCNGGSNGSVVITPSGGTGPYTITPAQTGLAAGNYTFTITDANGCSINIPVTITQPTPITTTSTTTNVACNGEATGSATVTASGGTPPYSYSWNTTPTQTTATASGLAAGSYTVTVTDAKGCTKTATVTISQPTSLSTTTAITNVSCNGGSNGSVVITPSGGTSPYTTTPAQTGLAAGNYTFTVKDANGCSISVPVTITQPTPITTTTTTTNVACNGASTGSATVTASGGTPPYSYSWNTTPTQTTATATDLASGSYTVTIIDAKGCTTTTTVSVTQPTSLSATTAITNVSCNGGSNGSVVITPSGGIGPYTITPAQTGLTAGSYTFTITDANGCSIDVPVTITQPTPITVTTAVTNVSCNGGSNGSVVITPSGGTGPYTITPAQTGLAAGSYTFTVKDANGCSISMPVTITQPTPITATTAIINVSCNEGSNGSVIITPSGGTGPYTITPAQTGLAAGNYTFTVTDANGCSINVPVTITQPTPITATTAITNVSCNGGSNGSVVITPSGGTGPYTITPAQTGLAAGNYTFTVKDANGCSINVPVTITQPSPITTTSTTTNVACNGASTGTATVTASGGTPPYSYSWNTTPTQTTATASGLAAGSYTVTVTDANGCTATATITITQPTSLSATTAITNVSCNGGSNGSVVITPSGGTGPYTITPAQIGLTAGNYTFIVTDANGCSITVPVTITQPSPITTASTTTD
ncbi:MAG: SprB repeat-containing protein, partial [Chitinophagaceae bacterium]|nr:SprB repeat-containing protein [Chitinophagaceae bacterium]